MRRLLSKLAHDCRGNAAAEMALVMPLLLILLFGSAELGNFFMNEHTLVKAVRDGARFAARQNFSNYTACSGEPGGTVVADTKNVVKRGYLTGGGSILTPNISDNNIDVRTECLASAGGQTMSGIYNGRIVGGVASGAQIVRVSASVPYRSLFGAMGFTNVGYNLNAASEAAVSGL